MSSTSLGGDNADSAGAKHRVVPGAKVALRGTTEVTAKASVTPPAKPVPSTADASIGQLVQSATQDISALLRGEIALAKLELQTSVKRGGVGVVLFIVAAVLALYAVTFGLIAYGEGLVAAGIWRWAAYLIVMLTLLIVAAVLGYVGFVLVRRVQAPKRTIASTKETVDVLRGRSETPKTSLQKSP